MRQTGIIYIAYTLTLFVRNNDNVNKVHSIVVDFNNNQLLINLLIN